MPNIRKQSKKRYHIIYRTTNLVNNMIYIGAHSTDLLDDGYLGSGYRLVMAITKYGTTSFKRDILHVFDTPEEMYKKESEIVNVDFLSNPNVYNIVEGGFGGHNKGTTGLKHLFHPESGKRCAAHPNTIPSMLIEGWIVGRHMSPTTDTVWVHKGTEKKMILPIDLEIYINDGWHKGLPRSPTKGKVWIYHPTSSEYSLCEKNEIEKMESLGWIKKKWAPIKKGATWVNNGTDNLRIDKTMLEDYITKGWKSGMITTRWQKYPV